MFLSSLLFTFSNCLQFLNFGSPFRIGRSTRGCKATLESFNLLGLALHYLKGKDVMYKICLIFGLIPSSLYVMLDHAPEVLLTPVTKTENKNYELRWPTSLEMNSPYTLLHTSREKVIISDEYLVSSMELECRAKIMQPH